MLLMLAPRVPKEKRGLDDAHPWIPAAHHEHQRFPASRHAWLMHGGLKTEMSVTARKHDICSVFCVFQALRRIPNPRPNPLMLMMRALAGVLSGGRCLQKTSTTRLRQKLKIESMMLSGVVFKTPPGEMRPGAQFRWGIAHFSR